MTETRDNPFANVFQFYIDQAEKLTPVFEQGIEDWFVVYNRLWKEGMQLQSKLIRQWTGNEESVKFNEQVKNLGDKIIEIQKEFNCNMVNANMKGLKSFLEAAMKSNA